VTETFNDHKIYPWIIHNPEIKEMKTTMQKSAIEKFMLSFPESLKGACL